MKNKILALTCLTLFSLSGNASYKMVFKTNPVSLPASNEEGSNIQSFQHLRIQILENNGSTQYVSLGDINWVINGQSYPESNLTAYIDSPSPYKVSDSGFVGTNSNIYGGWKLYDGGTGQYERWLGDNNYPHEIDIDLGQSFNISDLERIELKPGSHISADLNERSVRHFKVFFSEDGLSWDEALDVNNIESSEWQSGINNTYQF